MRTEKVVWRGEDDEVVLERWGDWSEEEGRVKMKSRHKVRKKRGETWVKRETWGVSGVVDLRRAALGPVDEEEVVVPEPGERPRWWQWMTQEGMQRVREFNRRKEGDG